MKRGSNAAYGVFLRYALTNVLILFLPTALALVFYAINVRTVQDYVDEVTMVQLESGAASVDKRFLDIQVAAAQLAIDYEVNFYLNNGGPFTAPEFYDLKRISEKLSSFVLGNEILSHLFLYFSASDIIAYDSGASAYSSFYGPVFSVQGRSDVEWREEILSASGRERLIEAKETVFSGLKADSLVEIRPIGFGDFRRGAIIGIIDVKNLKKLLAALPEKYGGWTAVYDERGSLIGTTDAERERLSGQGGASLAAGGSQVLSLRAEGQVWRRYRSLSGSSGWTYVAVLNETALLAGARNARNISFIIVGTGLLLGFIVSYAFAYSNSRPIAKLFSLVLGEESGKSRGAKSAFQRLEDAISVMSDSKKRLEREVGLAKKLSRAYFFQALFEGRYRDRELFSKDASGFGIDLSGDARFVAMCRLAVPGETGQGIQEELARAAEHAGEGTLGDGEYLCNLSLGEFAFVLGSPSARREKALGLLAALREEIDPALRGSISFGVGEPIEDPFLLSLSFSQAEAALRGSERNERIDGVFYEEIPKSPIGFHYPPDVEVGIIRAVRSANADLLASSLESMERWNYSERLLSQAEERDLVAAVRGTAIRLFAEFPRESEPLRERLYRFPESLPSREAVRGIAGLLHELARARHGFKKSHNAKLTEAVRAYIGERFGDWRLSLYMVAEEFKISENYLSNLYKEQTGECVSETIEAMRIESAKRLLRDSSESVDSIAGRTGYQSGASFRRAFKRVIGISPSDFRNR